MSLRLDENGLAGRIWPAGGSLETPGLSPCGDVITTHITLNSQQE